MPSNHPEEVEVYRQVTFYSHLPHEQAGAQASHVGKQNLRAACLKGKLEFMFDSSPACTVPYRNCDHHTLPCEQDRITSAAMCAMAGR